MTPLPQTDARSVWRRLTMVLMGLAILLNVATFSFSDPDDTRRYRALHREATVDLMEIGLTRSPHFVQFYAPALALADQVPGVRVVKPATDDEPFDVDFRVRMLGFGRASEVVERAYDPVAVLPEVSWRDHVVAAGEGGERGPPFAVSILGADAGTIVALGDDGFLLLVDARLVPDHAVQIGDP